MGMPCIHAHKSLLISKVVDNWMELISLHFICHCF